MKKLTFNGITIEVKEGKKSPIISIVTDSNDVDILFNDSTIFSGYEQDEYQYIHPFMRPFVEKHSYRLEKDVTLKKKNYLLAELTVEREDVSAFFPYNRKNPILFRLSTIVSHKDLTNHIFPEKFDFTSPEEVQEMEEANKAILKAWTKLEQTLKKYDFDFELADYCEGYDAWWDVIVPFDKWNETGFKEVLQAVSDYRKISRPYTND